VGEHVIYSNFSRDPVAGYPTAENFFQALKTDNLAERSRFKSPDMTPGQAKRAGRKLTMTTQQLDAWNNGGGREAAMAKVIALKFAPGTELAQKLVATGDQELIEGNNWHDNIWGNCTCKNLDGEHPECLNQGTNLLGETLMAHRTVLNAMALATTS
jgi:ribA/ribD-fused uncharacterized protein